MVQLRNSDEYALTIPVAPDALFLEVQDEYAHVLITVVTRTAPPPHPHSLGMRTISRGGLRLPTSRLRVLEVVTIQEASLWLSIRRQRPLALPTTRLASLELTDRERTLELD